MNLMFNKFFSGAHDLILVIGMIGVLLILFVPISPGVLDFLLLTNFSFALLILLITFYIEKPLEFSTFPSLLLMTTLLRLSLNVSTTRLILQQGDAGRVIDAIGSHVVAGNYVIGLVIFFILIVVQFIVVTSGAQRVAEVAARFTLDSLPGKQMSIDADLNLGIIDTEESKRRRGLLEKESNFYGAMDGASKFVKGDAVAGIIIILINIIGGLLIGVFQHHMAWSDALHHYTLLTVGDGIVTQIPSLIIAVASGIIITRAATDSRLGAEIVKQFTANPKVIVILVVTLIAEIFIPGLPAVPIFCLITVFGVITWFIFKRATIAQKDNMVDTREARGDDQHYQDMMSSLLEIKMGNVLHEYLGKEEYEIERRISLLRKNIASELGFVLPTLTFKKDARLKSDEYRIFIHGECFSHGQLKPSCLLAINSRGEKVEIQGEDTREPTYGLPAKWIAPEVRATALAAGYTIIEPETVLLTHLQEITKRHAGNFITRNEVENMISLRRSELGNLVDEIIPNLLSYSDIQRVLQGLLAEQVPIRNLPVIFDVLADGARTIKDSEELVELCREKLKGSICDSLSDAEGNLHVMTFFPALERKLISSVMQREESIPISPKELDAIISKLSAEVERLLKMNINPVILCAAPIRRFIRKMLRKPLPLVRIISINEVDEKVGVVSASIISLDREGAL